MKTFVSLTALALVLGACAKTPEPICDREGQAWDKFGTQEDVCDVTNNYSPVWPTDRDGDARDPSRPVDPDVPDTDRPDSDRPALAAKVKGNNGLGNGDQSAPGNSLGNNRAENERGNPGHNSGKAQNSN